MRWLMVIACAASCHGREDCCDLGSGYAHLEADACVEAGGLTVDEYLCEGVDDEDGVPDRDDTDATDETLPDDQAGRCERFCALEMALCPGDDACPTSCNESTTPPGQADVDCVAAATTCEETFPCWAFQTFD
jgi:hypothetical protein